MSSKAVKISVLSVIMVVLIIVLGVPYSIGFWMEKQFPQRLKAVQEKNPKLTLDVTAYHRGFFSTDIQLTLQPNNEKLRERLEADGSNKALFQFPIKALAHVRHGVLLLKPQINGAFHWGFGLAFVDAQVAQPGMQAKMTASVSLSHQVALDVQVPAVRLTMNGLLVTLRDASWSGLLDQRSKKVNGRFDLAQLTVDQQASASSKGIRVIDLSGFSIDLKHVQSIDDILYGTRVVSLSKLLVSGYDSDKKLHIKPVVLNVKTEANKEKTNSFIDYQFSGVTLGDTSFGSASTQLDFKNMNTEKLKDFMMAAQKLQSSANADALKAQQLTLLKPALSLLSKGMMMTLSSQYDTGEGLVQLDVDASIPQDSSGNADPLFLSKMIMKGKVTAPLAWFKKSLNTLVKHQDEVKAHEAYDDGKDKVIKAEKKVDYFKDLVDNHVIVVNKNNVMLMMSFDENGFLVNGKPLNLPPSVVNEF